MQEAGEQGRDDQHLAVRLIAAHESSHGSSQSMRLGHTDPTGMHMACSGQTEQWFAQTDVSSGGVGVVGVSSLVRLLHVCCDAKRARTHDDLPVPARSLAYMHMHMCMDMHMYMYMYHVSKESELTADIMQST